MQLATTGRPRHHPSIHTQFSTNVDFCHSSKIHRHVCLQMFVLSQRKFKIVEERSVSAKDKS